jgi:hypothetical protein
VANKQTKKKTTSTESDRARLVAPAPIKVLAGVVFLCVVGLLASARLPEDWMAVAGCIVVLSSGAVVLEYTGRAEAARHPHPLYEPGRLPSDSPRLKVVSVVLVLVILVLVISASVRPGQSASPFPFFLAAAYLFLVLPQVLARRALRLYDGSTSETVISGDSGKAKRKRRRKKHKKH